jgi:membrane associated rhomboid family serine protease
VFIYPVNRDQVTAPSLVFVVLTAVNTFLLAITYFADSKTVFMHYGFIPAHPSVASVFSSMFLHSGILHLLGNTWFFWMFGPRVENNLGRVPFLLLYLTSGLGATGLHYAFNATSNIPCVGASGAISGVAAAYFILFPRSLFDLEIYFFRFHLKTIAAHTHVALGVWIGEQLVLGLLTRFARFSAVAFWGHVGGFATGVVFVLAVVAIRPREDDGLHFSVPAQIFLPVRNVDSMRRWYRKLGFVEAAMTQEDKDYGGVLALKAGGDGEPILFRHADVHDTPVTLLINAEQPAKARTTLSYKGLPVSSIWWDKQGTQCFSLHDVEGNTIKFVKE